MQDFARILDDEEFAYLGDVLNLPLKDTELDQIKKEADKSKIGYVDWTEWVAWWRSDAPMLQKIKQQKRDKLKKQEMEDKEKRDLFYGEAMKQVEVDPTAWIVQQGKIKPKALIDKRIEVAGLGRGTVLDTAKKGLLRVEFDARALASTRSRALESQDLEEVDAEDPEDPEDGDPQPTIQNVNLKKVSWKLLSHARCTMHAKNEIEKYDLEISQRKEKHALKCQAERDVIAAGWRQSYGVKKNKGAFGALIAKRVKEVKEEEVDAKSIVPDIEKIFKELDDDRSGNIDKYELEDIDKWFDKLNLQDELGMSIDEGQYAEARADLLDGRWTIDYDDLEEWILHNKSTVAVSVRIALQFIVDERIAEQRLIMAKAGEASGEAAVDHSNKKGKRKKKAQYVDPPFAEEYRAFFDKIKDKTTDTLERSSLNKMISLLDMEQMLDRELGLMWSEINSFDTVFQGVTAQIFVDWCSSDTNYAIKFSTIIADQRGEVMMTTWS